jgi:predicted Fe-Mo cluster-binding NifX family protein
MKVAISTDQRYVSAHFGRCSSYTIVEIIEGNILSRKEIPNPGHQPGFLPQFLSEKGVSCIIAGGMGPRAQGLFAQKNIETITGIQGPVDEVIEKFVHQELEPGEDLCGHQHGGVQGHFVQHHLPDHRPRPTGSKICITAQGKDLEAEVDPSFGRARYFLIVDPETLSFEVEENPNFGLPQGAGIQTAQFISSKNVGTLLTGSIGPNARRVLQSSGIEIMTGVSGKIKDALFKFKSEVT